MSILKGDNPQGVGRLGSCGSDTAGAACSCHFHFRVQFGHSPTVSVVGKGEVWEGVFYCGQMLWATLENTYF